MAQFTLTEINLATLLSTNYTNIMKETRTRLGNRTSTYGLPVLRASPPNTPAGDKQIVFFDWAIRADANNSIKLRIRLDNLYLVGFQMQSNGNWFEFNPDRTNSLQLITGSTYLGFKGSYGAMQSADGGELAKATFSRDVLVKGVQLLNNPNTPSNTRAEQLIRVIVFICESLRFTLISDFLAELFVRPDHVRVLTGRMTAVINNWGKLSNLLVVRERDPANYFPLNPPPPAMEIVTYRDAVDVLGILNETAVVQATILPNVLEMSTTINNVVVTDDDDEQYYPLGDPMVEVIWVKIDNACDLYGTIQVIDGIGSQYLYQKPRGESVKTAPGELVLLSSPPDHSIVAYDCFTINVDLKEDAGIHTTDTINNGKIFWNAFNTTNNVYDQPIQEVVKGEYGSVTVNYVVLSDAVKAQLEVTLIKGDVDGVDSAADIYGDLNVRIANFEDRSVLFKKKASSEEHISVSPGNPIPLLKSAVAAPLNSFLVIEADISPDRGIAQGTAEFPTQLSGTTEKSIYGKCGEIRVKVTWTKET